MTEPRRPFAAGLEALSNGKLILLLAVMTAVLGVGAMLPILPTLRDTMLETLAGDHFARNAATLAPTDVFDFFREKGAVIDGVRHAIGGMGWLGLILQAFFAGGIVSVLGRGPFTFGHFFEPARRNFWHNVKCGLLFAISLAVALGVWLGGGAAARTKLLEDVPPDAAVRPITFWALALVALVLFAALSLLYDFARAARRYAPAIGAWRAFRFARRAAAGSWGAALGLWFAWFLLGGAAVLLALAGAWFMRAESPAAIALLMVLQFAVLGLRSAVRVAAWGSYVAFLDARAPRALSETARVRVVSALSAATPA
jgi:hypothetical protein